MTALGGLVGRFPVGVLRRRAEAILHSQSDCASEAPKVAAVDGAALGAALRGLLPFTEVALVGNGRFLLAADVRLDNRDEIASACGLARADELSDTAILLHAWGRWESRCLDRLVGDFAIAVFDRSDRSLSLVRDPTGQRPLFYATLAQGAAFASMPAGLCNADESLRRWDMRQLADQLAMPAPDAAETYFSGISRVLPGEIVRIRDGTIQRRMFWKPEEQHHAPLPFRDSVERYRELLDDAVRCRMRRSRGRVAVHLSSGYDSSAVATSAAVQSPGDTILAYTAAPPAHFRAPISRSHSGDESALAALTATKHRMRHRVVHSADLSLDHLRRQARFYQEPFQNLLNTLWSDEILRAARRDGASVLLSGALGNSTLNAGGLRYLSDWVAQRGLRAWSRQARAAVRREDVSWRGVLFSSFGPWIPAPLSNALMNRFLGVRTSVDNRFLQPEWARAPVRPERLQQSSGAAERLRTIRLCDSGQLCKGSLAYSGIWELDPLSDRRIVEFSLGYAADQLIRDGEFRPLAREALEDRFPPEVLNSRKRGFQAADWQERFTPQTAAAIVDEVEVCDTACALLDLGAIRSAIRDWPDDELTIGARMHTYMWRLPVALATGIFLKEFETMWREADGSADRRRAASAPAVSAVHG